MDSVWKVLLSVAAALLGALVMRWWDRARALVLLQGFVNIVADGTISSPEQLRQLAQKAWKVDALPHQTTADELHRLLKDVRHRREKWMETAPEVGRLRTTLAANSEDDAIFDAMVEMSRSWDMEHAFLQAVKEERIVPRREAYRGAPKLEVDYDHGSFYVKCERGMTRIGRDIDSTSVLKADLDWWFNAVRFLDRDAVLGAFDILPPLLAEQAKIDAEIAEVILPLLKMHSRWMIKIHVTNYGAKDMVVWPDATLVVRGARTIAEPCMLEGLEKPESRELESIIGLHFLPAGSSATIWAGTTRWQCDMRDGALLRTAFQDGKAMAHVRLRITKRRSFRGLATRSEETAFTAAGWEPAFSASDLT
jgi:hypothetical protein